MFLKEKTIKRIRNKATFKKKSSECKKEHVNKKSIMLAKSRHIMTIIELVLIKINLIMQFKNFLMKNFFLMHYKSEIIYLNIYLCSIYHIRSAL